MTEIAGNHEVLIAAGRRELDSLTRNIARAEFEIKNLTELLDKKIEDRDATVKAHRDLLASLEALEPTCCDKHKAFGLGIGGFCDGNPYVVDSTIRTAFKLDDECPK